MPRTRKVCPICGQKGLLKLSNHLANVHKLSSEERQSYLIRAKRMPVDIATVLTELRRAFLRDWLERPQPPVKYISNAT